MDTEIKARLDAWVLREITAAEAIPPAPLTPRERHQRVLTLATLFRVAILSATLGRMLAARVTPAPEPTGPTPPKRPRKAGSRGPAPTPAKETDMDDAAPDDTAPDAADEDTSRLDALRDAIERRLERLTGRRESKGCPEGFERIGARAADGQLADDGQRRPAAPGGG